MACGLAVAWIGGCSASPSTVTPDGGDAGSADVNGNGGDASEVATGGCSDEAGLDAPEEAPGASDAVAGKPSCTEP
jgi:hypothetical protein